MKRMPSPRSVHVTRTKMPFASMPSVLKRCSSPWGSSTVIAFGSSSAGTQSAKRIPCLRKLDLALAGSKDTIYAQCAYVHRGAESGASLLPSESRLTAQWIARNTRATSALVLRIQQLLDQFAHQLSLVRRQREERVDGVLIHRVDPELRGLFAQALAACLGAVLQDRGLDSEHLRQRAKAPEPRNALPMQPT